jgi:methylenetetrahydrofolate dehydrogenase (NADP+) / methenyltetrahydrofolate cyclohydrolase
MKELIAQPVNSRIGAATLAASVALVDQGIDPCLAVVLVGEDSASVRYVQRKEDRAKELGIILSLYHIETTEPFQAVSDTLAFLAADETVHGIILQLPLPDQYTQEQVDQLIQIIPPEKDVDGLRAMWQVAPAATARKSLELATGFIPPMVAAIVLLLDEYGYDLAAMNTVVVGAGRLVGQPLSNFAEQIKKPLVLVDEETEKIFDVTQKADVLVAATGMKELITYQWISEGAVVIDCGNEVHRDSVDQRAAAVSPSRGGVGPITVEWLMHNVIMAAQNQQSA